MKISYDWLKTYIETDLSPEAAAEKLTLLGLEVEEVRTTGSKFDGVVVGEVVEVADHPSADELRLCRVDLGSGAKPVQIVCGADNVAAGQKVPVATVGSVLPAPPDEGPGLEIKKMKLRGEVSEGMICSEVELGLGDERSGIMVLDGSLESGTALQKVLNLRSDTIFEIGLTPNRPDASCHIGVARDLAAVLDKKIHNPYDVQLGEAEDTGDWIDILIEDTRQCHRYVGKIVTDLTVAESPDWLKNRLHSIGLRPINNVVDATNFVLHEIGQPLHAFDYKKLKEKKIIVKSFEKTRRFQTLDGVNRKIEPGTLFICDGQRPVALAGVMGGGNTEVTSQTRTILIESAYFDPSSIRRASKNTTLQTDSSYRFERGVDPNLTRKACERAALLIAELSGGRIVEGCIDVHPVKTEPLTIGLRTGRLNQLLGTGLGTDDIKRVLNALELEARETGEDQLECVVPTFRPDITREVDLIEEVGRIFDYNNIPKPTTSPFLRPSTLSKWEKLLNRVRTIATRLQYKEITTNSLLSASEESLFSETEQQLHTLNPVSREATTLRTSLLAGFMKVLQFNLNRKAEQLRLFETGHTYRKSKNGTWIDGVEEHGKLLLGLCGFQQTENWRHSAQPFTIFDLKSDLESFFSQFGIMEALDTELESGKLDYLLDDKSVATLHLIPEEITRRYEIDLPVFAAEVNLTLIYQAGFSDPEHRYEKVPRFPTFEYDVAYIVGQNVTAGELARRIRNTAGGILHKLEVFDVFTGESLGKEKKSFAFRLTFLDCNKTLNINDVDPVIQNITQVLETDLGAKLRS